MASFVNYFTGASAEITNLTSKIQNLEQEKKRLEKQITDINNEKQILTKNCNEFSESLKVS